MDANPPSSGDFAYSASQDNAVAIKDALVLIGWLSERISFLESASLMRSPTFLPELPSHMQGFACYPRRDQAVRDAMAAITSAA